MNTKDDWKTTARVTNPERRAFWERVFGKDQVPIVSFVPQAAKLPGFDEPQLVYMLDLKAISEEQRGRLVEAIAEKFEIAADVVNDTLDEHGVPILMSDVSVSSTDRALVMGMIL